MYQVNLENRLLLHNLICWMHIQRWNEISHCTVFPAVHKDDTSNTPFMSLSLRMILLYPSSGITLRCMMYYTSISRTINCQEDKIEYFPTTLQRIMWPTKRDFLQRHRDDVSNETQTCKSLHNNPGCDLSVEFSLSTVVKKTFWGLVPVTLVLSWKLNSWFISLASSTQSSCKLYHNYVLDVYFCVLNIYAKDSIKYSVLTLCNCQENQRFDTVSPISKECVSDSWILVVV